MSEATVMRCPDRRDKLRLSIVLTENWELTHRSAKKDVGELTNNGVASERTAGLIPLINPVDHADQGEGGRARRHRRTGVPLALHVGDHVLDEVYVILLAAVDLAAQRGRQRMVLVQHD